MGELISDTGTLTRPDGTTIFWRSRRPAGSPSAAVAAGAVSPSAAVAVAAGAVSPAAAVAVAAGAVSPSAAVAVAAGAPAKALVVIVHGVAEHSGRYAHVMEHLASAGYAVFACDLRGHGDSSGKRVYVERFREYSDDVQAVIAHAQTLVPGRKVVLLGHSMGALVAIQHLIDCAGVAELAVLSGPGVGIAVAVPKWKDALGRLMSKVWPSLAIPTGIGAELVSRDPAVVAAYRDDPKVTRKATARWYTEFLDAQQRAFDRAGGIKLPLLVLTAGLDGLVSVPAQEKWVKAVGSADKTHIPYPALFHEVMNEPEKAAVLGDITRWLDARV